MRFFKSLPLNLVLLATDISPSSATLVPRSIQRVHDAAVGHTRSLARDLRVAFGGILVSQPNPPSQHVVYCRPGRPGGSPAITNGGAGNTTTTGTPGTPSGSSRPNSGSTTRSSSTRPQPTGKPPASSPWKIVQTYEGESFFNGWDFFTGSDPTHGIVQYVDQNTARGSGILDINSEGNAIMRVETTETVPNTRQSIRITTQAQFNGGLVIMDSIHMPTGCGTWPAFWTNGADLPPFYPKQKLIIYLGPNWPAGGEIDIVEGVHDYTNNQATIHTNPGCTLPTTNTNSLAISGSVIGGTDCAAETTGNQGCGIRARSGNTFGAGFNNNGGGVYAMKWDSSGVAIYFFPRGSIPADITDSVPQPDTWGAAQARWPSTSCNAFQFFNNHHAIFDTTLCGDWAGAVWTSSGIPGQEQSCAQRTGFPTCEAFVRASGSSFSEAYWEVKSVKIYQFSG
ncbi:concanavalin A-like lectin/glucanase domain-containing protein [Collybia nuda]|uniref:Concanavalin A-like lectin/glucanase domain-containing protein n=1 Tax=Collybia nuda TaxID=64659 RepID=A0A9P6CAV1_9AGAR|nr:concanavalin A-like lectin/glucanase domain-containing protein [Collybia nuda]